MIERLDRRVKHRLPIANVTTGLRIRVNPSWRNLSTYLQYTPYYNYYYNYYCYCCCCGYHS